VVLGKGMNEDYDGDHAGGHEDDPVKSWWPGSDVLSGRDWGVIG